MSISGEDLRVEPFRLVEAIADNTPDFLYAFDLEGRILYANRRLLEVWSVTPEQARGKTLHELGYPQWHADMHLRELRQVIETKRPIKGEVPFTGGSGVSGVYEYIFTPVLGDDGRVQLIAGTTREVSGRREGERARAHLAAVVESSDDAIVTKNLDGIIQTWNAGAQRIFGWTAEEVIGQSITIIIPADRLHEEPQILARLRAGERVDHFETVRMRKDGTPVEISVTISPIRDADGRVVGASKIARDITIRRRAEALARDDATAVEAINRIGHAVAGELDLDRLVQTVTDATTTLTGAEFGSFFYNVVNERGESYVLYALSGVDRSEFERFPMPRNTEIFAPTFNGEGVVRLDDVTADPRYGKSAPHYGMPKGHLPVRSYLAVPVVSRSGEVLGGLFFGHSRVGVFTERHERIVGGVAASAAVAIDNARLFDAARRANDEKDKLLESERAARGEAERAGRLKDDFLATLSHELRTPLNAILGWSQILRTSAGVDAEPDLVEGVVTIERNARAQAQIIDDLLDMSRIISGKLRLDVQRVDLAEVVRAAVDTVRPAADAKGVRLQPVVDPLVGPVSGDPHRLHQVLWNLLTNAVKFTPRGGRVQVLLERVNSHLEVSVIDTGEGIKPEFLPHVFDRFRQADASTTRRHGGLGLGLAIVKQLVELHGGSVRVKSGGEGQGATFTLALPLIVLHPEPADPADGAEGRRHPRASGLGGVDAALSDACVRLNGVKVLAIDDEADARELIRRLLEDCDAEVLAASSAAEALAALESFQPDVIVSDIGMPGEDGYTMIRRIRALGAARGGRVPAVALTAYARAEDRMRALAAGFQMHVVKPVEPAELIMVVASLAGRVSP